MSTSAPGRDRRLPDLRVGPLLLAGALGCAGGAYALAAVAGKSTGTGRVVLLAAGAVLAAAVVALGAARDRRKSGQVRSAERVAIEAQAELETTVLGAFGPLTAYLAELAGSPSPATRAVVTGQVQQAVVDAAVHLTVPGARSAFYGLNSSGNRLSRQSYAGRSAEPRSSFRAGTPDGESVLELVRSGTPLLIDDVRVDPLVEPTAGSGYRTVIAVPVRAGALRIGMLTVDAPVPGSLSPSHIDQMRVLANALAAGIGTLVALDRAGA